MVAKSNVQRILVILTVLMVSSSLNAYAQGDTPPPPSEITFTLKDNVDSLRVRSGAGTDFAVLGILDASTIETFVIDPQRYDPNSDWIEGTFGETQTGFIYADYTDVTLVDSTDGSTNQASASEVDSGYYMNTFPESVRSIYSRGTVIVDSEGRISLEIPNLGITHRYNNETGLFEAIHQGIYFYEQAAGMPEIFRAIEEGRVEAYFDESLGLLRITSINGQAADSFRNVVAPEMIRTLSLNNLESNT